ncbi:MAG: universal stress protein [Janthinobacterium lividum]
MNVHTTVGFSGSGASRRALRWALQEATLTGRAVHVVAVDPPHGPRHPDPSLPVLQQLPSDVLERTLGEELQRLPGRAGAVTTSVVTGDPGPALLLAAAGSSSLVLGCGRKVGPIGPGSGRVIRACLTKAPVPVVLVGPQAVLAAPRRLLLVSSPDVAVTDWVLGAAGRTRVSLRLLTTWSATSIATRPSTAERRHAHLLAAQRHQQVRARLASGSARPLRADITEGELAEVVPQRVSVGDLVVVGASDLRRLAVRTLRAPVVLVPASRAVVLSDVEGRIADLTTGSEVLQGIR